MAYNRTFHWGYGATLKEKLKTAEVANAPHFMRGCLVGYAAWVFGLLVWPGPLFALPFSLGVVVLMTLGWELRDYYKADGFDWLDIGCDLLGWGMVQLTHYATHWWD